MKKTHAQIQELVKAKFPNLDLQWAESEIGDQYVLVPSEDVRNVISYLKDSSELSFDFLMSLSAFDGLKWTENGAGDFVEVTYHLYSYVFRHTLIVKARPKRNQGVLPSLTSVYGCADFQEREVYDHFGIQFSGHPSLTRILLPEDWVGHPLLKDYQEQEEYNGIATTRPSML